MIRQHFRHHLPALVLWTLMWGLFFGAFLLGHEQLAAGDLSGQSHAFAQFQARELRAGRLPLWSTGSYGGFPFAADPQAAVFYPPRWLTILTTPSGELPLAALQGEILAHVWLAGLFAYGFTYTMTAKPWASLVSAVSFGLGGYLTGYPLLQLAILETIAWLPAVLMAVQIAFGARRPAPWLVAAGLALALAGLAGHPQTWMHVAYLAGAWFLFRGLVARWHWRTLFASGGLVALTALGVSAVAWVPALRYMLHTSRSLVGYDFVSSGLPVADWLQTVVPTTMSLWAPQYGGMASAALALFAWRVRGSMGARRSETVFWALAALVSAWLALGDTGGLFRLAHGLLPGMALFRQQERFLGLCAMSLSILAGLGLAAWLDATSVERRLALAWAARWLAVALAAVLGLLALWQRPGGAWEAVWLRHALLALIVLGLLSMERRRRLATGVLVLLLAADLYVVSLSTVLRKPANDGGQWAAPHWLAYLRTQEPSRIDLTGLVYANWGEIYGLETISGISPLRPILLEDLEQLPRERYWQLLNVSHVISTQHMPGQPGLTELYHVPLGTIANQEAEGWVYRVEETLPRAFVVHEAEIVGAIPLALERLRDPAWDPTSSVVLLASEAPTLLSPTAPDRPATVAVQRISPRSLALSVKTEAPGYLVISEWSLPGWRATLDGDPVPLFRANYAFQAVHVVAGEHMVHLTYTGADVIWSGVASLVALAGALAAALLWRPSTQPAIRGAWVWPARLHLPDRELGAVAERSLAMALTLLALAVRLYGLGRMELAIEEALAYLQIRQAYATGAVHLSQVGDLWAASWYPALLRGWTWAFGAGEFVLRLPAALAGAALIPALWRLGRRLAGAWIGLGVAALATLSSGLVGASQNADGRLVLALLLVALASHALLQAAEGGAWRQWVLYALVSALAVGAWAPAGWAVFAHGVYLWKCDGQRRQQALLAWAPVGLMCIAWTVWAQRTAWPGLAQALEPEAASAGFTYLLQSLTLWTGGSGWGPTARASIGVGSLGLLVWIGRDAWRKSDPVASLLLGWLLAVLGGLFALSLVAAVGEYRQEMVLLAAPAWWGLALLWARSLWRRGAGPGRALVFLMLIAWVFLSAVGVWRYHARRTTADELGYAALAAAMQAEALPDELRGREEAKPGTPLFMVEKDPRWSYYLRNTSFWPVFLSDAILADADTLARVFMPLLEGGERLWVALPSRDRSEREALVGLWLAERALPVREIQGARHLVAAYESVEQNADALRPVDVAYGDGAITLVAAHLLVNGRSVPAADGPIALSAGERLDVTLVWQAGGPTERSLTVFVHLIDGDGRLAAQHDGLPANGQRPTTMWQAGQLVLDRHTFAAPSSGPSWQGYIQVGLYDSETVERAVTVDGRDAVRLYEMRFVAEQELRGQ